MNKKIALTIVLNFIFIFLYSQSKEKLFFDKIDNKILINSGYELILIPEINIYIGSTEVTQKLYEDVLGINPSWWNYDNPFIYKSDKDYLKHLSVDNTDFFPVDSVSWFDAIYFCNKLSEKCNLTPVYSINGETDVNKWNYIPNPKPRYCYDIEQFQYIEQNLSANGFRLPTKAEWLYAANLKEYSKKNIQEYSWKLIPDESYTHPVALKKANIYGLFDIIGNVQEYCWDSDPEWAHGKISMGGYYTTTESFINEEYIEANMQDSATGLRIVCSFLCK